MNFFRFTTIGLILFFTFTQNIFAENHETKKNIVEQSKDLNKQIIEKQTVTQENIGSEIVLGIIFFIFLSAFGIFI